MEHFLPQSDIRTEDHKITEIAVCQLSLRESVVNFADVMLRFLDISNKYPDPNARKATLVMRTLCAKFAPARFLNSRGREAQIFGTSHKSHYLNYFC